MSPIISLARRNMAKESPVPTSPQGEVEEPLASLAEHGRPAQVHPTVRDDGAHLDDPMRAVGVTSDQADGLLADLDGDVHVVQQHALRHELGTR